MHLHTNNKAMGAGNLIPKSSGKIFQYYSTSVISFINGVMFLSMSGFFFFDICRELSHQWPWDWQICLGTWSWARESVWVSLRLDGTVRSNHLKLGIKFLNHRWIIILSICTTNPRLNERYTTTVPVRQKINHFPQGNRGYTLKINFQKLIISISNCMLLKNVANGFPFQRVLFPLLWPLSFFLLFSTAN